MFIALTGGNAGITNDLSGVLTAIGDVLTQMFSWISKVFDSVVNNPILFIMVVGTFGLIAIGIVRRLLKL